MRARPPRGLPVEPSKRSSAPAYAPPHTKHQKSGYDFPRNAAALILSIVFWCIFPTTAM